MSQKINIAIDGVAGSGKGTSAKLLAEKLGYQYLDTGSMYRVIALYLYEKNIAHEDITEKSFDWCTISFSANNDIHLNDRNREKDIRNDTVGDLASSYARHPLVRDFLSILQKSMVQDKWWIADGRDIGTMIMPEAEIKFFLTASSLVRAQRRQLDYKQLWISKTVESIQKELEERDAQDVWRELSPLVHLKEAHLIDTSDYTLEQQVERMYEIVQGIL